MKLEYEGVNVWSLEDFFLNLKLSNEEKDRLRIIYKFVQTKMKKLKRKSWEPYFNHCIRTAQILIEECNIENLDVILLALMHDIKEDTNTYNETMKIIWSEKIKEEIFLLSKNDENIKINNKIQRNKQYFERLQQVDDEAVLFVKIADRIDNLRTMIWVFSLEKIKKKLNETKQYILPLAEKLKNKYYEPYEILLNSIIYIEKYLKEVKANEELTNLLSKK